MNKLNRNAAAVALALALAACGGGGEDENQRAEKEAAWNRDAAASPDAVTPATTPSSRTKGSGRRGALALPPDLNIPPDASTKGVYGPLRSWPVIAVHAVLMPDGRVMSYGTKLDGQQTGFFNYDLWDSTQAVDGGHTTLANGTATDIFCSSQVLLPDSDSPRVFIAGGDNWTGTGTTNTGNNNSNLLNPADNSLQRGINMNRARWYSTSTVLLSGEVLVQGGSSGTDRPEIRGRDGTFRLLSGDTSSLDFMYPRNFVAPDGRVFGYDSNGRMYYLNPTTGALTLLSQFASAYRGSDASAAMFRPGRILQFGGNSNGAIVIDITGGNPVVTPTASMASQRRLGTATLLADGRVLATGGSPVWNDLNGAALNAEIWNPQSGQWTVGATGAVARLYHSNALLLPDATVLVAGGGAPGPLNNLNAEIYYPPYLFTSDGKEAPRPAITATPDFLLVGKTVAVDVTSDTAITRVTLVKTGSTTHGWNMEQRFVELPFRAEGSRLNVQAPTRAADVPPGYYQLFVFDSKGVPSMAKVLYLGIAADPNPQVVPVLASPGNQTSVVGSNVDLALQATDPNGDTLRYSATGLPPGLSINTATGRISGTPGTVGSYDVVLGVTDGYNSASANIVWQVGGEQPLQFDPLPPPQGVVSGSEASFSATARGKDVQYKWNFGDGSAETSWSTSGNATHVYTRGGAFFVTVTARDSYGTEQALTFLQVVYLPTGAAPPKASGPILSEQPVGGGNPRLWVVNPDNDSVSVFDAVTRAKLSEINVGTAPRTLARAADGRIWVTNLRGTSISVIDPATRTVAATIALPRGSQPYGVAMSPSGAQAFVTLEGAGTLLRFDTASRTQTGSLSVGQNARHVAVSADGARAFVSRFITPPLPGEATASLAPTPSSGGQLLVVDTAAMSLQRTIILQHSDVPDAETQGRGIPNYLGALALSPDGSQGYVPSKQDNLKRGALRDGLPLNFQNTVRAVSSRIVLGTQAEDLAGRIDHDNASLATAALFDTRGVYLFVALETSREIALLDAHSRAPLLRVDVGRAPQGLALSPDGLTLYASNFMDRTVSVLDLKPLLQQGQLNMPLVATLNTVATDKLSAQVLQGKRLFYDARDIRLSRDRYMSCATCHADGAADGRVWDLTDAGEGLRNTINLRGRAAMGHGPLHWTANFDELQDFEGQIRRLAGGTGLMSDAAYFAGTRSAPLGDPKAGQSADLDALAAYVASLSAFDQSAARPANGVLSSAAVLGKTVFQTHNCAACHGGTPFTRSGTLGLSDIGTLKPSSGQRLGGPLTGLDTPTLRDAWLSAPYLHDGSAATLDAAVAAHLGVNLNGADMGNLVAYLREIGSDETTAPAGGAPGNGAGLSGRYFANATLSGTYALARTEAVDFDWGSGTPGAGVPADNFSVRWTGKLIAPTSGLYRLRTVSDDGVRLWVNGTPMIDNWTDHGPTTDTTAAIPLGAGAQVDIKLEYYERGGGATMRLQWLPPGGAAYAAIPTAQLVPGEAGGIGLTSKYYNNKTMSGTVALTRIEAVDFSWGTGSPGTGVNTDNFSVRWTGTIEPTVTGTHYFQTVSDDGVRLYVNGTRRIDNWTNHGPTVNTSSGVSLTAGKRYTVTLEYYEATGGTEIRLRWKPPGSGSYVAIPAARLYPN